MSATYSSHAADHWTDNTSTDQITPLATGVLFVVAMTGIANTDAAPTCTDDQTGGTYYFAGRGRFNGSADQLAVYVRQALVSTTSTHTVHPVFSGGVTASAIDVVAYAGMTLTGAAAVKQIAFQENGSAASTPSVTLAGAALTTNPTIAIIGSNRNGTGVTVPASWTLRSDDGTGTPDVGTETATRDSGFTGSSVTWGSTSANVFAACILELDSSAGGAITAHLASASLVATATLIKTTVQTTASGPSVNRAASLFDRETNK